MNLAKNCSRWPDGCVVCDLEFCDGKKETVTKNLVVANNMLRKMVGVKSYKCDPCKPTHPECDACEFCKGKIKHLIICGFPGVGKTTAERRSREVIDCESTAFHFTFENGMQKENPDWVSKYVDHIEQLASKENYQYILVSSHLKVRVEMEKRGIPYICVVPEIYLRDEYLARYVKRGDSAAFIQRLYDHWNEWLEEIDRHGAPVIHLAEGQNISDMIPQ